MPTEDDKLVNTIITFLVVPAIPAIILVSLLVVQYPPKTALEGIAAYGGLFYFGYWIAIAHVLILGLPAFLLGRRLRAIRWWTCLIVGFVIGYLPITVWMQAPWTGFVTWGVLGGIGGLVFWLLWRF